MDNLFDIRTTNLTKTFQEILVLLEIDDDMKSILVKRLDSLALERFIIVLLDRIKDGDTSTKEKFREILESEEGNRNLADQFEKLQSTLKDLISAEEARELYFYSKVSVLLEVIQPYLEKGSEDSQAAIGEILSSNEDLKKAILSQSALQ